MAHFISVSPRLARMQCLFNYKLNRTAAGISPDKKICAAFRIDIQLLFFNFYHSLCLSSHRVLLFTRCHFIYIIWVFEFIACICIWHLWIRWYDFFRWLNIYYSACCMNSISTGIWYPILLLFIMDGMQREYWPIDSHNENIRTCEMFRNFNWNALAEKSRPAKQFDDMLG